MRHDIYQLTEYLKQYSFTPNTFAEIGSRDGHDSHYISNYWGIPNKNVYIFEAHQGCYKSIIDLYPQYNTFNVAINNKTSPTEFNAGIIGEEPNVGISSLLNRSNNPTFKSELIKIDGWSLDDIIKELNLPPIDLIKIDVEGATHKVLEGYSQNIINTKYIQIELETKVVWDNQMIHDDIITIMDKLGFEVINDIILSHNQNDTLFKNKNL